MAWTELAQAGIEFPRPGESIAPGSYTFRVAAPTDAIEVDISIDDEPWRACRQSGGYWWFHWSSEVVGNYVTVSRVIGKNGSLVVTSPRHFRVQKR